MGSCRINNIENSKFYCDKLNLICDNKESLVVFHTSKGIIEVQLFVDSNPVTTANFISNVKKNLYLNKNFYKIIDFPETKIIHLGHNLSDSFEKIIIKNSFTRKKIPLEIKLKSKEPMYGIQIFDPAEIQKLQNKFEKGSLSMVKVDDKNSSSTELFFTLNKSSVFDGRYSLFGKVVKGFEILDKINKNDFIKKIEFAY
tara:strand:- start:505 stop:1101 length:597 start_codon:yes stop_codon:yes gene_type:complete